jgi:Nif-specific regulatory protein
MSSDAEARIVRERDLYRSLLEFGATEDLERLLGQALDLMIDVVGAKRGMLELWEADDAADEPSWSMARGCTEQDISDIRAKISRGIIAEALATGETISTHSAMRDERFADRKSVQMARIEAVLCAPMGSMPGFGAVYLEGRHEPGGFTEHDRADVELFARHLGTLADRLLVRRRESDRRDPTREVRSRYALDDIVGRSPALAHALEQAMLAAPLDVTVLLTGESGTGKSQLARAIHENSPRRQRAFVELNCANLPEGLVESELFGAVTGAHSTAHRDRMGRVEAAEGGTLFLDEVGDLPYEAQAKLLQLLQSRQYYALGSDKPQSADVRLVAATNADLDVLVAERRFRQDLLFRLQVLPVKLPPLSARREDLRELALALVPRVSQRNGLEPLPLSAGALMAIESAEWPGNVRQLENMLEAAAIRATGERAPEVASRHVFPDSSAPGVSPAAAEALTFQDATRLFQRDLLARTLEDTEWNVSETARRLELARSHVYNLIKGFGLEREK